MSTPDDIAAARAQDCRPAPRHSLACAIWQSADPADTCDCDARPSTAEPLDRIHVDENREAS